MRLSKQNEKLDFTLDEYFWQLTKNQKLAIIHFLSVIAVSDTSQKSNNNEGELINLCYEKFRVKGDEFLMYTAIGGREQTAQYLLKMSHENLFGLVMLTHEMSVLNGRPSDAYFKALIEWLADLNMTSEEWFEMDA